MNVCTKSLLFGREILVKIFYIVVSDGELYYCPRPD